MDFLDPNKKRLRTRKLFIMYFFAGIGIILSSLILLYITFGYKFDSSTREIVKNGLIFTDSSPTSSSIYINGKQKGETEERFTVPEGKYNIELRKEGYISWKKTINLGGGKIERLIYPKLIPSKLTTAESKNYIGNPTFSTESLDRKKIVIATPNSVSNFDIFDTSKPEDPAKTIDIPQSIYSTPKNVSTEKLKLVEWASDNKHFLVKHFYDDKFEFVVINIDEPAESVNINKLHGFNPISILLRDKKHDQLYIQKEDLSLNIATTKNVEITPILQNVSNFKTNRDNIVIYSTNDPKTPDKTNVKILLDDDTYNIATFTKSEMFLDIVEFDDDWSAVVVSKTEGKMSIFNDPFHKKDKKPLNNLRAFKSLNIVNPTELSFSTTVRFALAQSSTNLAIYDFEDHKKFEYKFDTPLANEQLANWMDGHRLLITKDNKVQLFEFDNHNKTSLVTINTDSEPFFDRDYLRIFTLAPTKNNPGNSSLTRTSLKVGLKN